MSLKITCDGCDRRETLQRGTDQTNTIKPCTISCVAPAPWGNKTIERDLCQDCCRRVAEFADPAKWARNAD